MERGPAKRPPSRPAKRGTPARQKTKIIGQSTNKIGDKSWEDLFTSRTLARLLTAFLIHPDAAYYQRELVDRAGARLFTVQRELARLEKAGLVVRTRRGNRVYYQASRRHPAFEDLKRVILKTTGLGDALRHALAPLADRVHMAFVYGSWARGEEVADSDLDLLLIGDLKLREAATVLGPVGRQLGREFNPSVYPAAEFRRKAQAGHPFIAGVLQGEKIFLIGDEDELGRVVG
jgi:predicted nucleotidyltransferase